jgi:hypothetical protein
MENFTAVTRNQPASPERSLGAGDADDQQARLDYWTRIVAADEAERRLYRQPHHEYEASLMRRPLTPKDAYGQLGLLLGIIPPTAIFYQISSNLFLRSSDAAGTVLIIALFVLMNVICASVGRAMGRGLAAAAFDIERFSWSAMLLTIPFVGLTWGLVTGFLGGLLFFGLGGVVGAFIAGIVGTIAFTVFAILHRLLERGSLIDRRIFLPLAYGISLTMAAFFLGL